VLWRHALQNIQNDCHQWLSHSFIKHKKFVFGRGSAPDPAGELTALPQTLYSWFKLIFLQLTLIQAFISNRLDYCNAALCGITDTLLRQLQSVQNAAARLLTQTGRREHITPVLRQLHWLPVSRRIDFKLAVLMYQISRGLDPTYLQDRCRLASEVSSG